ncbi:MAG: ABC-2 type transport system ATP-binding protein [Planctomycetota bacterium]|jgi:ABC-2 type transport system ATP-binding protein
MNAVRLTGVTKTYGSHKAVDSLDLAIPEGSVYGFIGPNGSGKTTTIRMILHIIHPDTGEIEVLGKHESRASNDRIGYLPEERGMYKKMTVKRLLTYYGSLKGMTARDAKRAGSEWMERLELGDWLDKKIESLSKGMAQKVQFISTVISAPELVILDEPFSGLDPVNLEVLREAILGLREQGSTVIFSTHDMSMAEQMCDSVFMIFRGKKVLDGTVAEIRARYGADTIRLKVAGGREALNGIDGIDRIVDMGHMQEVRCVGDTQELLRSLLAKTSVHHFEEATPSLHNIFVRIAGPESEEVAHV